MMHSGRKPAKVKRRDASSSSGTTAAGLAAEAESAADRAAEKAAKLAREQAGNMAGDNGKSTENIPPEMRALWQAFSPDERKAILAKSRVRIVVTDAYSKLAEALKAIKIKPTDPLIITADGRLLDPETFNADDPEEENGSETDDEADDDDGESDDEEGEDDEKPWTKGEARQVVKHLRAYMRDNDISQAKVAEALGVTQAAISSWFRKKDAVLPRAGNLDNIAEYLNENDPPPETEEEE